MYFQMSVLLLSQWQPTRLIALFAIPTSPHHSQHVLKLLVLHLVSENVAVGCKHRCYFRPEFCHRVSSTRYVVVELLKSYANRLSQVAQCPQSIREFCPRWPWPGIFVFCWW